MNTETTATPATTATAETPAKRNPKTLYIGAFPTEDDADEYTKSTLNACIIQQQGDQWHLWIIV